MAVTTINRGERKAPDLTGKSRQYLLFFFLALAILPAAPPARAGTVFMKNGYLIQGPVVEHSPDSVVLGWPNGKVTIYRRFFDKVDLEPGEEKNFRAPETTGPSIDEEELVTAQPDEELPQSLSDLVKAYHLPPALVEPHPAALGSPTEDPKGTEGGTAPETGHQPPPGGEPDSVASTVPAEDAGLADRSTAPKWGFSIRPPAGWRVSEVEGCVSWIGQAGPEGFAPSISVTSVKRGSLKWEEATKTLREDQQTPLREYKLIAEEAVEVGGRTAYQVSGQGTAGGRPGLPKKRSVKVRQVLLEEGDRYWLVSSFLHTAVPEDLAALLDRSIQTFKVEG
jgi:hypothetical protein